MEQPKSCLIVGAGDATGAAIAKRFAKEGYKVCLARRTRHLDLLIELADEIKKDGGEAFAFGVDAREEDEIISLFENIESSIAPLDVVIFNIGANVNFSITETTSRVYRKVWEMAAFAGFLTGREAAKHMLKREQGTILFTGATASLRGGIGYSAFAGGKFALRALAQSMARELGPKNIHVAHIVIDGAIDSPFIREVLPNVDQIRDEDKILNPDHIAENYWVLHQQPRTAWTHELDLRPWAEKW